MGSFAPCCCWIQLYSSCEKNIDVIGLICEITMFWPYGCYDYVSSRLHNDVLPAHHPQNRWAQKNLVESACAANVFAQLYRIKLLRVKKRDKADRRVWQTTETCIWNTSAFNRLWLCGKKKTCSVTRYMIYDTVSQCSENHKQNSWCMAEEFHQNQKATLVTKTFCFAVRVGKRTFLGMTIYQKNPIKSDKCMQTV